MNIESLLAFRSIFGDEIGNATHRKKFPIQFSIPVFLSNCYSPYCGGARKRQDYLRKSSHLPTSRFGSLYVRITVS